MFRRSAIRALAAAFLPASLFCGRASGDERYFTYTYEPKVLPKDSFEFEQWATLRAGKESGVFSQWDLRSEFEVGLLDRLTTALYLNFEAVHEDREVGGVVVQSDTFEWEGLSSEWKLKLFDPTADPLGVLLYGEVSSNFQELEVEEKLVLGKDFDRLVLAFNTILEEEWKFGREETERELGLEFTAGAAYRLGDHFAIGVEAREANVFEDMQDLEHAALFVGPVLHYARNRWWVTLTVMPQVVAFEGRTQGSVDLDEFERAEARIILGFNF